MQPAIKLFDVVALTEALPSRHLVRGQVGTVVEVHPQGVFEVEFADDQGRTYSLLALPARQLIVLHYQPAAA